MNKAIFLDRDGTLNNNRDHYYIWRVEDFQLIPGVVEALTEFRKRGYMLIVITNQGGVSKGIYTVEDVEKLHYHMQSLFEQKGVLIEEIYYCPHHSDNEVCRCRKPQPLLIEKAIERFNIDPALSYFIGDADRDMEAGKAAGLRTILIVSNSDLRTVFDQID